MHVRTHVRAWQCICAYDKHTTKVYSIQQNFRANTYRAHREPRKFFFFYCTNIVPRLQELLRLFVKGLVDVKAAYSYDFFRIVLYWTIRVFAFGVRAFAVFRYSLCETRASRILRLTRNFPSDKMNKRTHWRHWELLLCHRQLNIESGRSCQHMQTSPQDTVNIMFHSMGVGTDPRRSTSPSGGERGVRAR